MCPVIVDPSVLVLHACGQFPLSTKERHAEFCQFINGEVTLAHVRPLTANGEVCFAPRRVDMVDRGPHGESAPIFRVVRNGQERPVQLLTGVEVAPARLHYGVMDITDVA